MDYSAVSADAEGLHGPSPWGSSSPRTNRSSFPTAAVEPPDSPLPSPQHAYSRSQDSAAEASHEPALRSNDASAGQPSPYSSAPVGQAHRSQIEPQEQQSSAQEDRHAGAARYQSSRQQRPVPQYKLQAKVTALERTGRKDPVIRFDVHVHFRPPRRRDETRLMLCRPIYPNSARLSFATCAERIRNS